MQSGSVISFDEVTELIVCNAAHCCFFCFFLIFLFSGFYSELADI